MRPADSMPDVLLVIARGGPALEYALPRVTNGRRVHVLMCVPLPTWQEQLLHEHAASVLRPSSADLVESIVKSASDVGARAVVTFSEFAIGAVAQAATLLGLRGPGGNLRLARDKVAMRQAWAAAQVPIPRFREVRSPQALREAYNSLDKPFLVKSAWSAGSIGQAVVAQGADLGPIWAELNAALASAETAGTVEPLAAGRGAQFIAEDIIDSTTDSWYDVEGYGDYVSVEGLVVEGAYTPICITARLPTIPPFTEVSNHAPCILPDELQRLLERHARRAVEALKLQTCGTHTEIKLCRDGQVALLESSARLGGAMVLREVLEVYGIDLIDLHIRSLLGDAIALPQRMLTRADADGAAASLSLLAANSSGVPWSRLPTFAPEHVDWSRLVSPDTTVEIVRGHTIPSGSPMPPYTSATGALNYAGLVFVRAPDPLTLKTDCLSILDGLEAEMLRADRA